jgi:hypothetical protein
MSGMSNPSCTGWTFSLYSPYTCACAAGVMVPSASTSKAPAVAPSQGHATQAVNFPGATSRGARCR